MIVAVIDHWDDEGRFPHSFVDKMDECYLAIIDTEVVGAFNDCDKAIRRIWQRRATLWDLEFPPEMLKPFR